MMNYYLLLKLYALTGTRFAINFGELSILLFNTLLYTFKLLIFRPQL
jgi:hypothetical protein